MNREKIPFLCIIAIYISVILVFLGMTLFEINKNVVTSSSSIIPILSEDKLNKVVKQLEDSIKIDPPAKVDLSQFNFGKEEPFSPLLVPLKGGE